MNLQDEKDSVAIIESEIPELEFYQDVTGYWQWRYRCLDSMDIDEIESSNPMTVLEAFIQFTKYVLDAQDELTN